MSHFETFVPDQKVATAMSALETAADAPERYSVENVLAKIGNLAEAHRYQLSVLMGANNTAHEKPWLNEPWGSQLLRVFHEGYALGSRALFLVTSYEMDRLEEDTILVRADDVRKGIQILLGYRAQRIPTDEGLDSLVDRKAKWDAGLVRSS